MEQASTIAAVARLIAYTLKDYDVDTRRLFERAGVALDDIGKPAARFSSPAMQKLWRLAVEETGDPCLGVIAGAKVQPAAMHGLGFSWLSSDTLYDALTRLVRFQRALSTIAKLSLEEKDGLVTLVFNARRMGFNIENATYEVAMAVSVRMCRLAQAADFSPLQVRLCRPRPGCHERIETFFKAPVEYVAEENSLVFRAEDLKKPLPNANPELARVNDQVVIEYLNRFDRSQISMQVRARIIEALPSGQPTQPDIAKALHLSLRNLQRKLQAENTNFKAILEEIRRELATQYIREAHLSIGEITYLLGFAETSNFTRAFKRWTGKSPKEYRQQVGEEA